VAGWLGVGVGGGASADPAITEGSVVEGEGRGRAFGVGMSDPGRKTRRGGGSSSRGKELGARAGGTGGIPGGEIGARAGSGAGACGMREEDARGACEMQGGRRACAAAGITAPGERGRGIAGGGMVRLVDALVPPLRISRDVLDFFLILVSLQWVFQYFLLRCCLLIALVQIYFASCEP
jgi:hypothetical protein